MIQQRAGHLQTVIDHCLRNTIGQRRHKPIIHPAVLPHVPQPHGFSANNNNLGIPFDLDKANERVLPSRETAVNMPGMLLLQEELNRASFRNPSHPAVQSGPAEPPLTAPHHPYTVQLTQFLRKYGDNQTMGKVQKYAHLIHTDISHQECRKAILELYDIVITLQADSKVAIRSPLSQTWTPVQPSVSGPSTEPSLRPTQSS